MKQIIQQIGPDGKAKYIEKVATSHSDGKLTMTSEVFEEVTGEQQFEIDLMKEGKAKIEALLHFADYCVECDEFSKGYLNYSSALRRTILDGKIIQKYKILAERAYQGIIRCNSCGDEYTWEKSSGELEEYRQLFQYTPQPIDTKDIVLPEELKALAEVIAKNVHEVWSENRMKEGWRYGEKRDDTKKLHPGLVDYEQLSETEKDYDRRTSQETLKLILKLGFKISK